MKEYIILLTNTIISIILCSFILIYLLNIKKPIPKILIDLFSEPYFKFIVFILIYFLSFFNKPIACISIIIATLIILDINNLIK